MGHNFIGRANLKGENAHCQPGSLKIPEDQGVLEERGFEFPEIALR